DTPLRVAGPPAEAADPATLPLGGATPDAVLHLLRERVLEALARDGAGGADGLGGGDGVVVPPPGEEQVGVSAGAGAVVHPAGVGDDFGAHHAPSWRQRP